MIYTCYTTWDIGTYNFFFLEMSVRRKLGARRYKTYTDENLKAALTLVSSGEMSLRDISAMYNISKSTLSRKNNNKNMKNVGRPSILTKVDEEALVSGLITASKWGFPLTALDIRLIVKSFLDSNGLRVEIFKNNLPGVVWVRSFLKRHKDTLTVRLSENIKRCRSGVDSEIISNYFDELKVTLKDVKPEAILNYDETNFTDDPGKVKVIVRRGAKHVERIIDASKSSTSLMFSGTASGILLPIYIVYKADHLYDAWTTNAPKGTRFNRSHSGWFDTTIFEDWFFSIVLPYFKKLGDQKKVMIGDNLSSHISQKVIQCCHDNNISFVLLPPNSTHLTQPLDVAYFRPLKIKWRQVLNSWKEKNKGNVPKTHFPRLVGLTMKELGSQSSKNLIAGFESCGIVPLNPQKVLNHIPNSNSNAMSDSWLRTFEGFLEQQRRKETTVKTKKRRLTVPPGQSIAHPNNNSDDEDDPDINVVLSDQDEISVNENLIEHIPKTSRSNQNNISHDVENNLLNEPKHFNIGDFILVKYLYNAGTKKEHFKFFPCLIKEKSSNSIYECKFMRNYKGQTETFIFPSVDDIAEVKKKTSSEFLKLNLSIVANLILICDIVIFFFLLII